MLVSCNTVPSTLLARILNYWREHDHLVQALVLPTDVWGQHFVPIWYSRYSRGEKIYDWEHSCCTLIHHYTQIHTPTHTQKHTDKNTLRHTEANTDIHLKSNRQALTQTPTRYAVTYWKISLTDTVGLMRVNIPLVK